MIIKNNRIWFKKVDIFLEDSLPSQAELEKDYDSVTIVSHQSLNFDGWLVKEKNTALIDLTGSPEEIFRRFNDTTRNEIRRTFNDQTVQFFYGQNSQALYGLYASFEKSQKRIPVPKREMDVFRAAWIVSEGEILSGLYLIESKPRLRIRSIFSKRLLVNDKEFLKKISNLSRRLIWELCLEAKRRGFVLIDVASVNSTNPKSANIAKFKMSFGGKIIKEYTYFYKSKFFRYFEKIWQIIILIRKKI